MIILDIEGSGTEPHIHSIVSIGALDFANPDNRFYMECRVWEVDGERAHIMDGALEVNGFTFDEITDPQKPSEAEAVRNFLAWAETCEERTLCGQNPSYDRDFLSAACGRAHENWPLAYRTIDTHTLCHMHMVKRGYEVPTDPEHKRSMLNLDAVLNYCGIDEEPHPHNALTGALCHAEVTSRLLYDQKLLLEFMDKEIPWVE